MNSEREHTPDYLEWEKFRDACSKCARTLAQGVKNSGYKPDGAWVISPWKHKKHWENYKILCTECARAFRISIGWKPKNPSKSEKQAVANSPTDIGVQPEEPGLVWATRFYKVAVAELNKVMGKPYDTASNPLELLEKNLLPFLKRNQ